jgi:membrane associated rhomboid family serine protease
MFPLNDVEPNRYGPFSFMTLTLIMVNLFIFVAQQLIFETDPHKVVDMIWVYGSTSGVVWAGAGSGAVTAISSTFLHGSFFHVGGNMLALWVFGRRVEDACGPWRFLIFYLTCGVTADISSVALFGESMIPSIGASGAVYGVMGAYLLLFPDGRIRTLVWVFVPLFPRIRAFWIILLFLLLEIPPVVDALLHGTTFWTNHWAHLGGFFGALFVFLALRPEALHRYRLGLEV